MVGQHDSWGPRAMPDLDLDDLEAKARAATPGWRRQGAAEKHHVFIQHDHGIAPELGRVLLRMNEHFPYEADAAFVAACSPDVVRALVERGRSAAARASWALSNCSQRTGARD